MLLIFFALHELDAVRDAGRPGAAPGPFRLPFSPASGAASGAYVSAAGEGSGARLHLSREPRDGAVYIEPARLSRDARDPVLVLAAPGVRARINGIVAPAVSVLREGDILSIAARGALASARVETEVRPYVGPPRAGDAGRNCSLCLAPIAASAPDESSASGTAATDPDPTTAPALIFECPFCETVVLHVHAVIDGEILECARLTGSCPSCGAPVHISDHDAATREEGDDATLH